MIQETLRKKIRNFITAPFWDFSSLVCIMTKTKLEIEVATHALELDFMIVDPTHDLKSSFFFF